jgi:hypothetical protein
MKKPIVVVSMCEGRVITKEEASRIVSRRYLKLIRKGSTEDGLEISNGTYNKSNHK